MSTAAERPQPDVDPVARLLDVRRARHGNARRIGGAVAAVLLHAAVVGAVVVGPRFLRHDRQVVEFVPVQLVPAPRRGVVNPAPPQPAPRPTATAEPAPEAEPSAAPAEPAEPPPQPAPPEPARTPPPKAPAATAPAPPAAPAPARPNSGLPGPEGAPNGNPDSPFTATVGGVDNPTFTYGYYLDRMLLLIRTQWVRPPLGSGVEATIHFRILRDGTVEEVELVNSSGYNSFDLAALRAIQAAAPLPPLPRSYREGELGVNLIFR